MSSIEVIFMFLGGLPTGSVLDCWLKCGIKNNERIAIVCHSKDPNIEHDLGNVHLTRRVETAWATSSLVDATLIMMEEAYNKFKNAKKFILLSPSCIPLYNIDKLIDKVLENNKTWITQVCYEHNKNSFDCDIFLASQWFITILQTLKF